MSVPSRHIVGTLAMIIAVVTLGAACGIPEDSAPRALGNVLATPTPTPTPEPASTQEFTIYLVAADGQLAPVTREVPKPLNLQALLDQLTVPVTDEEREAGLGNAIPATTAFNPATRIDEERRVAIIDLQAGSYDESVIGDSLKVALAQLVYTFTESGSIDQVRLLIEGERRAWPTSDGESNQLLDTEDYYTFDPEFVPEPTATPLTDTASATG